MQSLTISWSRSPHTSRGAVVPVNRFGRKSVTWKTRLSNAKFEISQFCVSYFMGERLVLSFFWPTRCMHGWTSWEVPQSSIERPGPLKNNLLGHLLECLRYWVIRTLADNWIHVATSYDYKIAHFATDERDLAILLASLSTLMRQSIQTDPLKIVEFLHLKVAKVYDQNTQVHT